MVRLPWVPQTKGGNCQRPRSLGSKIYLFLSSSMQQAERPGHGKLFDSDANDRRSSEHISHCLCPNPPSYSRASSSYAARSSFSSSLSLSLTSTACKKAPQTRWIFFLCISLPLNTNKCTISHSLSLPLSWSQCYANYVFEGTFFAVIPLAPVAVHYTSYLAEHEF